MSSLGEDDNVLLNNGHDVDTKILTQDDNYGTEQKFSLAAPARSIHKSVAFKDIDASDDEKGTNSEENIKRLNRESSGFTKSKLNGEIHAKETEAAKSIVASEDNDSSCKDVSMTDGGSSATKILPPSNCRSSVSEMIGRLKESSAKNPKVSASSASTIGTRISGGLKKGNYSYLSQKFESDKPDNSEVSKNHIKVKVKTEFKSKSVDFERSTPPMIVEQLPSIKDRTTSSLENTETNNKTCELSDTATTKTAERLKKFEQLSSTSPMISAPPKLKKEVFVNTSKSNFQKAKAFWNRE